MILLDTDHISVLKYPDHPRFASLSRRLDTSPDQEIATTVITVEEQMRGWLAWLNRADSVTQQVPAYRELSGLFDFFSYWQVMLFDEQAADVFQRLRTRRVRVGSMDLKIAAITLVQDALLLSANLRDFKRVPDLRVEDWIN